LYKENVSKDTTSDWLDSTVQLGTLHKWLHEKNCVNGTETAPSIHDESDYPTMCPGKKEEAFFHM
jgi:hypothetical protein